MQYFKLFSLIIILRNKFFLFFSGINHISFFIKVFFKIFIQINLVDWDNRLYIYSSIVIIIILINQIFIVELNA